MLFGTYYMPKDQWPENLGISEPMPKGYIGQLWEPLAWIIRHGKKTNPVNVAELSLHLLNSTNHRELRANSSQEKSSLALSHDDVQPHFVIK
jgi:hypothetical protein